MENKNEIGEIKDEDISEEDFSEEILANEDTDWKAEALKLKGIAKRRATQLKKVKDADAKAQEEAKAKAKKEEKKPEESKPQDKKSDEEFGLLEKSYLRSADIVDEDEIELVKKLMKETGKDIDKLIESKYFKSELEELRTTKKNEKATSNVRGGKGTTKATDNPEYWIAKGVPPTAEQVPDRKTRAKIARAMMASTKSGKKFYNE